MATNGVGSCRDELVDTDTAARHSRYTSMLMPPASMHRRTPGFESLASPCDYQGRTISHCFHHMFITVSRRTSDAVDHLMVSPVLGVVLVEFANGYSYEYTNVSRRAICNLLMNPNMSLGFWVNQNCIRPERTQSLALNYDIIPA